MPALLSNASATGAPVEWSGGPGVFSLSGTIGGATVTLQYLGPDESTWLTGAPVLTASGLVAFALPPGRVRASVSGGSPSGLYARADQVKGQADSSAGGTVTTYAALVATAAAGALVPGAIYIDEYALAYIALSASVYAALASSAHQGTMTLAVALAIPSPTSGMTADITDILPSGEPIRIRYNGTAWKAQQPARCRLKGNGTATTSAQYPTNTRWGPPAGTFALFSAIDLSWRFQLSDSPDTDTLTSWRLKLGTVGDATDATILVSTGASVLVANENQRGYRTVLNIESATSVISDGLSAVTTVGFTAAALSTVGASAVSLASGTTASALFLGFDYTMGVASNPMSTTAIYTLMP